MSFLPITFPSLEDRCLKKAVHLKSPIDAQGDEIIRDTEEAAIFGCHCLENTNL